RRCANKQRLSPQQCCAVSGSDAAGERRQIQRHDSSTNFGGRGKAERGIGGENRGQRRRDGGHFQGVFFGCLRKESVSRAEWSAGRFAGWTGSRALSEGTLLATKIYGTKKYHGLFHKKALFGLARGSKRGYRGPSLRSGS